MWLPNGKKDEGNKRGDFEAPWAVMSISHYNSVKAKNSRAWRLKEFLLKLCVGWTESKKEAC